MNYQNTKEVKFYGLDQSMFTSNEDEGLDSTNQGQVNQSAQELRQLGAKATPNMKLRMKDPVPSKINLKSATKLDFLLARNYTNLTYILNVRELPHLTCYSKPTSTLQSIILCRCKKVT